MELSLFNNSNQESQNCLLSGLSYDALLSILSFLTPKELCNFAQVSRDCYSLSTEDTIWRSFLPKFQERYLKLFSMEKIPYPIPKSNVKQFYLNENLKVDTFSKFVGLWSEQWVDVDVHNSTKITFDGYKLNIHYTKNKFLAEYLNFDGQCLSFKLTGGDSGWSFYYFLRASNEEGSLELKVRRLHDDMEFSGFFVQRVSENQDIDMEDSQGQFINSNNIISGNFNIVRNHRSEGLNIRKRPVSLVY